MPEGERQRVGPRFIMGTGITLRRLTRDDLPHIRRWLDDPETRGLIGATAPMSEEDGEKWFEHADSDPSRIWYVIVADEDDSVIGEAGIEQPVEHRRPAAETFREGRPRVHGNQAIRAASR